MTKIISCWLWSVAIGSLLMPVYLEEEIHLSMSFLCSVIALAWTLPLIIIELIVWWQYHLKAFDTAWQQYTVWKYAVALITVIGVGFVFERNMLMMVLVCFAIPGLLLHFLYLKKRLLRQVESGKHETLMEEDN
ncbi:MAG: hypothetical protein ACOVO3_02580 [Fluviicola sp.]|jgi:hypothetical protein